MTCTPIPSPSAARGVIVAAVRCRRTARDSGRPVLPALFAMLETHRCGMAAPAINSLVALFEARAGRAFYAGRAGDALVSDDEDRLLDILDEPNGLQRGADGPLDQHWASEMKIAARSTRIMMHFGAECSDRRAV